MQSARLSLALDQGALCLPPEGQIAVYRPTSAIELAPLPKARLRLVQGFKPDHDALAAAGYAVAPTAGAGPFAAAIVCLPRAKAEARALIAEAAAHLPPGAVLVVDGQKTDGVDAVLRDCRARMTVGEPVSKAHGKLFVCTAPGPQALQDWVATPATLQGGFVTLPGMFSADGIDRGSALLAAALPAVLPRRVADLGAGWGYLSRAVFDRQGVEELHVIEAEAAALDCARQNLGGDPRARFHWADATTLRLAGPVDMVVSNPPFHTGRAAEPALGAAFIAAAAGYLNPSGQFWMVANRHLPYEAPLHAAFREVAEVGGDSGFKLYRAARPHPPIKRR